jgi:hypothetical protein
MNLRHFIAALLFAALPAAAAVPAAQTVTVIEFYNATLDHYFMTADTAEAHDLDTGVHPGWARSGLTFLAIKAGEQVAGSTPICRFYGRPDTTPPLDSHFYSASVAECAAVQAQFAASWQLESQEIFRAMPVDPNTGRCATDFSPIYRLWNKRSDVNHRYTDQTSVYAQMIAKGYVAEGNGSPQQPVIFCMPAKSGGTGPDTTGTALPGTPACVLSASTTSPTVGGSITLTATCTNSPTSFAWTNCTSTTSTCTASATAAALVSYSVVGSNATGAGNSAKMDVTWTSTGGALPICTISASTTTPAAGDNITLTANCSQSPTRYDWMTCNPMLQLACNLIPTCPNTSATCTTSQSLVGAAHYALAATNGAGMGPRAGIDVNWGGTGTGGGGGLGGGATAPVCSVTASSSTQTVGLNVQLTASCSGNPTSYAWTNCNSTGPTCFATSANVGSVTYTVVGSNGIGNGAPASVSVGWQLPAPPSCTVSTSNSTPMAGTNVTLRANCSGAPTSYSWTGCPSSASTCQATSANAGVVNYTVAGMNNNGTGAAANVSVNWQPRPTAPPSCTVSADNTAPFTGQTITLTATCTNSPTSFAWTNCSSTASTCRTTNSTVGTQSYSVAATNDFGPGPQSIPTSVTWQQAVGSTDFCGQFSDVVRVNEPWGGAPLIPQNYGGSFRANMVLVVSLVVPATGSYGSPSFTSSVAEYQGSPTYRQVTLSRSQCDFRAFDPSGQAGPISIGLGNTATVSSSVGNGLPMIPGQTYYLNIRNWIPGRGTSCAQSPCNAIVGGLTWPH